jgi:hypothetical protein
MGVPNANISTTVPSTNMPLEPRYGELEGEKDRVDHMLHARLSSSMQLLEMRLEDRAAIVGLTCSKLGRMKEKTVKWKPSANF